MNQQSIKRSAVPLLLFAACLSVAAAIFDGACAVGSNTANGQSGTGQTNGQTTPAPQSGARRRAGNELLTGEAAKGDWTTDAPGVRRKLTPADLPSPYATQSVRNQPRLVAQPQGAMPQVPAGFRVEKFADNLANPRMIRTAPNGDLFVAESRANRVRVLRDADGDGRPEVSELFAEGLNQPFGIAFYPVGANPQYVYVANTGSVVRFPYRSGDTRARGAGETVVASIPSGGRLEGGGHWTRDVVFSKDGSKMYVSVGSKSNVSDDEAEARRARIFEYTPDGKNERVYAWGIRNPVGLAIHPATGELWTSVNERDELGDDLVPDYVTRVEQGGFYGWPWYYIGANQDPRHKDKHPELKDKVIVPDVLIESHTASLGMAFYTGDQFPPEYRNLPFAAQHGSWNRSRRTGYKVIYLPMQGERATGEYVDFMTGFVTPEGNVWGRPVAVTVGRGGALFVTDDGGNVIWRVSYSSASAGRRQIGLGSVTRRAGAFVICRSRMLSPARHS
ncbi:MAG TPA: sorbosone dehydrogenase family protein [Blastocatellia bacterium]|nr:sorbosone dehydrogenase family protein [Blastocatellia bacterium]